MAKEKVLKVIRFFEQGLKERGLNISMVILFGSQAGGKANEESDIDMVVVSEDFRGKDIFARVELIREAEIATIRKFIVPLDIVTMTPEEFESEKSLIAQYAKNGEVVFKSNIQRLG